MLQPFDWAPLAHWASYGQKGGQTVPLDCQNNDADVASDDYDNVLVDDSSDKSSTYYFSNIYSTVVLTILQDS